MPEQVRCPSCNAPLRVPDNLLGKNVRCPKCQTTFIAEMQEPAEPQGIVREPPPARRSGAREETEEEEFLEEEEEEERPRRHRRRKRRSAAAEAAVAGPAIALMVVGGIAIGLAVLALVLNLLGVGLLAAAPGGKGGPDSAARMVGGVMGAILGVCYGGIITAGAAKMKNLSSYGYAMTACIVAMLPCNLCCLLGLPFGIWGLVVINKPEVKNAFR